MKFFDGQIAQYLAQSSWVETVAPIARFFNYWGLGEHLALIALFFVVLGWVRARRDWVRIGWGGVLALILSGIIVQTLKHLLGRARPSLGLGDWFWIGPHFLPGGYDSFPSGHSLSSFTLAAYLSFFFPAFSVLFYAGAASIAFLGRVIMRHHFLTDAIVGSLLGYGLGRWTASWLKSWIFSIVKNTASAASWQPGFLQQVTQKKRLFLLLFFSALFLFPALGYNTFFDRDETEYAQASREMSNRQEWLIPYLGGHPFLEKPVAFYWSLAASKSILGESEFSLRLPSVILGALTILLTVAIGNMVFGGSAGLAAGFALLSFLIFIGAYRLVLVDPFFIFWTTLAVWFYLLGQKTQRVGWIIFTYLSLGVAVLTKGPFGFFLVPIFVLSEWWEAKEWKQFFVSIGKHSAYLLVGLLPCAPWYLYSFSKAQNEASSFLWVENIARFLHGMEGHTGPYYYYFIVLAVGLLPWTVYVLQYLKSNFEERLQNIEISFAEKFLFVWFFFLFIFFSISVNKLPHYILPVLPAAAIWVGRVVQLKQDPQKSTRWVLGVFFTLIFLATIVGHVAEPQYVPLSMTGIGLISLIALIIFAQTKVTPSIQFFFVQFIFVIALIFLGLRPIEKWRPVPILSKIIAATVPQEAALFSYNFYEPAQWYYSGRMFQDVRSGSLEDVFAKNPGAYILTREKDYLNERDALSNSSVEVLDSASGFAENRGALTLLLLKQKP